MTFNANGGTGSMTPQSFTKDTAFALKENTFTRTGYKFTGWSTKATPDEDSTEYLNVATVTLSASTTLYAQWAELTLSSISISQYPTTREYLLTPVDPAADPVTYTAIEADDVDLTGLVLTAAYDGGSTQEITYAANASAITKDFAADATLNAAGAVSVKVTYAVGDDSADATYTISLVTEQPISMTLKDGPTTDEYVVGQNFDPAGLAVYINMKNGTRVEHDGTDLTFRFSGFDSSAVTESQTVTVTADEYPGFSTTFPVKIVAKAVESVAIASGGAPTKTTYQAGETVDLAGLDLDVTYNDETTEAVTYADGIADRFKVSPATISNVEGGTQALTISYSEDGTTWKEAPTKPAVTVTNMYVVTVNVKDSASTPAAVSGAAVVLTSSSSANYPATESGTPGTYTVTVPKDASAYTVKVTKTGFTASGDQTVTVDGAKSVNISLAASDAATRDVTVTVVGKTSTNGDLNAKLGGATVTVISNDGATTYAVATTEADTESDNFGKVTISLYQDDGPFKFVVTKDGYKTTTSGEVATGTENTAVTVTAPKAVTLTYDPNGGEGSAFEDSTGVFDESYTAKAANFFTKLGYTIASWKSTRDGSGTPVSLTPGGTASLATSVNLTLYAQWTKKTDLKITYDANIPASGLTGTYTTTSGEDYEAVEQASLTADTAITLRDVTAAEGATAIHAGKWQTLTVADTDEVELVFDSWNTDPSGNGTKYTNAQEDVKILEDLTLYAQWKAPNYENNKLTGISAADITDDDNPVALTFDNTFDPEQGGYNLTVANSVEKVSVTPAFDEKAAVSWKVLTYETDEGADWDTLRTAIGTAIAGAYEGLGDLTYTDAIGEGYTVLDGSATVDFTSEGTTNPTILFFYVFPESRTGANGYAVVVEQEEPVVTFNGNGGRFPYDDNEAVVKFSVSDLAGTHPGSEGEEEEVSNFPEDSYGPWVERSGYVFIGWNTKADGEGEAKTLTDLKTATADTTVYAQWASTAVTFGAAADETALSDVLGNSYTGDLTVADLQSDVEIATSTDSDEYGEYTKLTVTGKAKNVVLDEESGEDGNYIVLAMTLPESGDKYPTNETDSVEFWWGDEAVGAGCFVAGVTAEEDFTEFADFEDDNTIYLFLNLNEIRDSEAIEAAAEAASEGDYIPELNTFFLGVYFGHGIIFDYYVIDVAGVQIEAPAPVFAANGVNVGEDGKAVFTLTNDDAGDGVSISYTVYTAATGTATVASAVTRDDEETGDTLTVTVPEGTEIPEEGLTYYVAVTSKTGYNLPSARVAITILPGAESPAQGGE